jgi:hypothetical protein
MSRLGLLPRWLFVVLVTFDVYHIYIQRVKPKGFLDLLLNVLVTVFMVDQMVDLLPFFMENL